MYEETCIVEENCYLFIMQTYWGVDKLKLCLALSVCVHLGICAKSACFWTCLNMLKFTYAVGPDMPELAVLRKFDQNWLSGMGIWATVRENVVKCSWSSSSGWSKQDKSP
jgi:hypothetical protein